MRRHRKQQPSTPEPGPVQVPQDSLMADVHRSVLESSRAEQARQAEEARLEAERRARIEAAAAEQAEAKKLRAEAPPGTADLLAKRAPRPTTAAPRSRAHVAAERAAQQRMGSVAAAAVAAERAKADTDPGTGTQAAATEDRATTTGGTGEEDDRRLSRLWWAAFLGPAIIVVAAALGTSWQDRPGGVLAFTLGVWALTLMLALPPVVSAERRSTWWLVPPVVMSFASALLAFGVMFGFAALTTGDDSPIGATDTTRQVELAPTTVNVAADLRARESTPSASLAGVPGEVPPTTTAEAAVTAPSAAAPGAAATPTTEPWPNFGPPTTEPWPDFGPNPGPPLTVPWPDFGPNPQPLDLSKIPGASPGTPAAG